MFLLPERLRVALKGWREPLSNSPPGRGPASVRQSKTRLLGLPSANRLRNRKSFGNKPPLGIGMYLWQFAALCLELVFVLSWRGGTANAKVGMKPGYFLLSAWVFRGLSPEPAPRSRSCCSASLWSKEI